MKILAFGDLHGNKKGMKIIFDKIKAIKPELLICIGDITDFGRHLDKICKDFDSLNIQFLLIHGNHETESDIKIVARKYKNIINMHKKFYNYKNYLFFGYGGGGFSLKDPSFESFIKRNNKKLKTKRKLIFLTHSPVYNTKLDHLTGSGHRGSISSRKFIEKYKPILVLCGHFHENEKKSDIIKNTNIINPGFDGMVIEV